MASKTTELILISAIVVLAVIIIIQSFSNTRLLYPLEHTPQIPVLSSIVNGVGQVQSQIVSKNGIACTAPSVPSTTITTALTQPANLTAIFKRVENSVVQITSKTTNPNLQIIINGNPLGGQSTRLGSGFVYDKQGCIITNDHVIDGANTADVTFVDGNTYTAKVVAKDPSSDIAILQITDNFS